MCLAEELDTGSFAYGAAEFQKFRNKITCLCPHLSAPGTINQQY